MRIKSFKLIDTNRMNENSQKRGPSERQLQRQRWPRVLRQQRQAEGEGIKT